MSGLKESSTFFIVQTLFSLTDISFSLPGLMIHAKFSTELKPVCWSKCKWFMCIWHRYI